MSYHVYLMPAAQRQLRNLPRHIQPQILQMIKALQVTPRPDGARPYKGLPHGYRLRYRDYRIIYQVDDGDRSVAVIRIGNRRDVYRS